MTIDLNPEQQHMIDLAISSGAYKDPAEVIDQAFEIIREQLQSQHWITGQRDEVRAQIEAGFAEAERGELIPGEIAIEDLRRRRAERLRKE